MPIPPDLEQRLKRLTEAFLIENAHINLSAFRTTEQCWTGNVLDSLALLDAPIPPFPKLANIRVADLGTGGGFPLLPLAMALPNARFTGIDSVQKKVDAVKRVTQKMHMSNVDFVVGRAEELGRDKQYRETFDLVTARAVAPINVLLEYSAPLIKVNGYIVLWKSLTIDEELTESLLARAELSCHLESTHTYDLGDDWGKRQLLLFKKTAVLSQKYPRETGVPKKDPIK